MKKRGSITTKEIIMFLPRVVLLIILVVFVSSVLNAYVYREVQTSELDAHTIMMRAIAPDCFAYQDQTRAYQGIVDKERVTDIIVQSCLDHKEIGARFILQESNTEEKITATANQDVFDNWAFCEIKKKKFSCHSESIYVLTEEKTPAYLTAEIVILEENG